MAKVASRCGNSLRFRLRFNKSLVIAVAMSWCTWFWSFFFRLVMIGPKCLQQFLAVNKLKQSPIAGPKKNSRKPLVPSMQLPSTLLLLNGLFPRIYLFELSSWSGAKWGFNKSGLQQIRGYPRTFAFATFSGAPRCCWGSLGNGKRGTKGRKRPTSGKGDFATPLFGSPSASVAPTDAK